MIIITFSNGVLKVYENKISNENRIFELKTDKVMFNNWEMPPKKTTGPKVGRKNS